MCFIIVGCLGSMGRRRIRNLKALGYTDIVGYDLADYKEAKPDCWYTDMLDEVENLLENPTGEDKKVDGIMVSVPPLKKQPYIDLGNKYNVPVFCEADVTDYSGNYTPSATMRFRPAIQKIKELLDSGTMGKVYTFTHHCGNHIEDWHPGTDMKTYYAAKKETGGCKEIFPFELSWLSYLFGTPVDTCGMIDKKLDDPDIAADDVYATVVRFCGANRDLRTVILKPTDNDNVYDVKNYLIQVTGTVLIDIVSRPAIRELRIVGEKCNLLWNWDEDNIQLEYPDGEINMIFYPKGQAAEGYNSNICEEMYQNELKAWLDDLQKIATYPYTRAEEEAVISTLRKVERQNAL